MTPNQRSNFEFLSMRFSYPHNPYQTTHAIGGCRNNYSVLSNRISYYVCTFDDVSSSESCGGRYSTGPSSFNPGTSNLNESTLCLTVRDRSSLPTVSMNNSLKNDKYLYNRFLDDGLDKLSVDLHVFSASASSFQSQDVMELIFR